MSDLPAYVECADVLRVCARRLPAVRAGDDLSGVARFAYRSPRRPCGMTDARVLEARDVHKSFRQGPAVLRGAARRQSARCASGERLAIVGASGSGKTTLLQILGGLDRPTRGRGGGRRPRHPRAERDASAACCATARSASSTSSITCCRSSPRWRMWRCRCWCGAAPVAEARAAARALLDAGGAGRAARAPAAPALRRRAPARRRGAGAGHAAAPRAGR